MSYIPYRINPKVKAPVSFMRDMKEDPGFHTVDVQHGDQPGVNADMQVAACNEVLE